MIKKSKLQKKLFIFEISIIIIIIIIIPKK